MRFSVFGATGGIGVEFVRQALAAGHEVVAVVRDPRRLAVPAQPRLTVFPAELAEPEDVVPAVEATDAVISALGPRPGDRAGILGTGARVQLAAMAKTGVRRLVVVSAAGAFVEPGDGPVTRAVVKPLLGRLLREGFVDVRAMEAEVRSSGVDWTIVRPPRLLNRAGRGRYRREFDRSVRGGRSIARADVAAALLDSAADDTTIGHMISIAD
jgi:putative NADH-flavin reductase